MTMRLAESVRKLMLACGVLAKAMGEAAARAGEMERLLKAAHRESLRWRLAAEATRMQILRAGRRRQRGTRRIRRMSIAQAAEAAHDLALRDDRAVQSGDMVLMAHLYLRGYDGERKNAP